MRTGETGAHGAQRLHAVRRLHLRRTGAPTVGDRWFSLYLILFLAGFYVIPLASVIGGFLDPGFGARITGEEAGEPVAAGAVLCGLAALWLGRVQGPAFLTPFLAHALLASDIDRRRVLARPTVSMIAGVALMCSAPAAVILFALTRAGVWSWAEFCAMTLAALFSGAHLGLVSFLGQRLQVRVLTLLSLLMLLLGAATLVLPGGMLLTPAGWIGLLWSGQGQWPTAALGLTAVVGLFIMTAVPPVLERMPARRVLTQSRRLSEARLFTSTGNINDAVELFRPKPRRRLSGAAVGSGAGMLAGLRRDLVSAARTPLSLVASCMTLPIGAALLAWAAPAVGEGFAESRLIVTVPLAVAGGLLILAGTGGVAEGWRQAKDEFDAAGLYGWSPVTGLLRRTLWPVLATATLTALGAAGAVALRGDGGWPAAAWAVGLAGVILSARFFQSMRPRDIPVGFLAPTVIPGGIDLSAVKILLWLGDGVLVTLTAVLGAVALPWSGARMVIILGVLALVCVIWGWVRTGQPLVVGSPRRHI